MRVPTVTVNGLSIDPSNPTDAGADATNDDALGLFFRDEVSTRWTIPHLGWSKDGRRLICRTNTGYSIASIDVSTKQVTAPIELPTDIDFAWWDRRIVAR